jgi:hypothetical protein
LIRKTQALISSKTLKHTLPIGMAANQHHPARTSCIGLKRPHIGTPAPEKLKKCSADGIFTKSTNQADWSA